MCLVAVFPGQESIEFRNCQGFHYQTPVRAADYRHSHPPVMIWHVASLAAYIAIYRGD